MKISPYLSHKIKVLSFIAIIFVLFIHSYILNVEVHTVFSFVQSIWGYFCGVFQPLFFATSGYLFFVGFNANKNAFIAKYKTRFKSLIIPYLFWNLACLFQMLALKYNPVIGHLINSSYQEILTSGIGGIAYHIFIEPAGFHLWFVRDLILIVCFAPVIWFLNKHVWFLFIPALIIGDISGIPLLASFVPFVIGALFAVKNINIELKIPPRYLLIFGVISVIIGVLHTLFINEPNTYRFYLVWTVLLFLWFGYDYVYDKGITFSSLKKVMPFTFFIYVFHEPSMNIFKRLILMTGKNSEISLWAAYFLSPVLIVLLSVCLAKLLQKYCLNFYKVITGGR